MEAGLREGEDEDQTAEQAVEDADYADDLDGGVVAPVDIRDVCVNADLLMPSKTMVKSMKISMLRRNKKNQK